MSNMKNSLSVYILSTVNSDNVNECTNLKSYINEKLEDNDKKIIKQISDDTSISVELLEKPYELYKNEFEAVPGSWKIDEKLDEKIKESNPDSLLQDHVLIFMDDDDVEYYYDAKEEKWKTEI